MISIGKDFLRILEIFWRTKEMDPAKFQLYKSASLILTTTD